MIDLKKADTEDPSSHKNTRGQNKKKKADGKSTGLTSHSGGMTGSTGLTGLRTGLTGAPSISENSSKSKTRPSFKELLAKYEKEGSV